MDHDLTLQRITSVASVPAELLDYQNWLSQHRSARGERDYLFAQERARFEPRSGDVVVALPGLRLQEKGRALRLSCSQPAVELELPGLSRRDAERALGSIDGKRCLAEVLWDSGLDQERLGRFLRATFGLVVFAPAAIEQLEGRLPGLQTVRFPCAPYAIERAYWQNMAEVRERIAESQASLLDRSGMLPTLRQLHVVALMGRRLDSFYKPASPSADTLVSPGSLFVAEPRLLPRSRYSIFLDGPRVNASPVGGEGWHQAVYRSVQDEAASGDRLEHEEQGLSWGRVEPARADKDERPRPWFLPPRPMLPAHFDQVHAALAEAHGCGERGDAEGAITACGRLHQRLIRLHPFHCANQSLAMNLVNWLLERAGSAGIPHLLLDMLALRLRPEAYERLFRRAVQAWSVEEPDPSRRFALLMERKARSNQLIEQLGRAASEQERQQAAAAAPQAARWALLAD
jgi:hypothetical protein